MIPTGMAALKPRKQPKWLDFKHVGREKYLAFFGRKTIGRVSLEEIAPYEFHPVAVTAARLSVKKVLTRRRKYIGRQESGFLEHDYDHAYWMSIKHMLGFPIRTYSALSIMEEIAFPTLFLARIEHFKMDQKQKERVPFSTIQEKLQHDSGYVYKKAQFLLEEIHPHFENTRDFYRALFSLHRSNEMNPFLHELNAISCTEELALRDPNDNLRVNAIMIRILHFMERKVHLYADQRRKVA